MTDAALRVAVPDEPRPAAVVEPIAPAFLPCVDVGIIDGQLDFAVNKVPDHGLIYREVDMAIDNPHVYTWAECRRYGLDDDPGSTNR